MEVKRLRLISIGFVAVAVIFLSISIGTNSWYVNKDIEGKVLYEMGLWKICVYGGSGEPCTSWEQNKATGMTKTFFINQFSFKKVALVFRQVIVSFCLKF